MNKNFIQFENHKMTNQPVRVFNHGLLTILFVVDRVALKSEDDGIEDDDIVPDYRYCHRLRLEVGALELQRHGTSAVHQQVEPSGGIGTRDHVKIFLRMSANFTFRLT